MKNMFKSLIIALSMMSGAIIANADPKTISKPPIASPSYKNFSYFGDKSNIAILRVRDGNTTKDILAYSGPMAKTTTKIIQYFHKQYPYIHEITLNSTGGLVTEGIRLGMYFSNTGMSVSISPNRVCLSACAYAFIGGTNYRIDGLLGFHTGFLMKRKDAPVLKSPKPDSTGVSPAVNHAYEHGHYMGAFYSKWFMQNGFNINLFMTIAAKTTMDKFYVMNHEKELYQWMARDNNSKVNDYTKFLVSKPKLTKGATIMTGKDMMMWLKANTGKNGQNNRGRKILSGKMLWSSTIKTRLLFFGK